MEYNKLGGSELLVSEIGFGAMSLDINNPKEAQLLLNHAFDSGINYFDTADLYNYGENEKLVGKCVKSFRNDVILATKVGNRWRTDKTGWDWDVSSSYLKLSIDQSLSNLDTDYIDLYQIHGGTIEDDFEEVVGTLDDFVKQGKIRYYGISSIRPNVFTKYCSNSNIVSNMMQYSIFDNRPEKYFPVFEKSNVSIIARGVLAQGYLLGKSPKNYLDFADNEVFEIQDYIRKISLDNNVNCTALALYYVLKNPIIASALIGFRTIEQISDVLTAYKDLEEFDFKFDDLKVKKIEYTQHL